MRGSSIVVQKALFSGKWSWVVPPGDWGRADTAILKAMQEEVPLSPSPSRTQLQNWMLAGHVFLAGHLLKPGERLRTKISKTLEIIFPEVPQVLWQARSGELSILYEDEFLLVVNKPAGLSVHPGQEAQEDSLVHRLLAYLPKLHQIGEAFRPGIVHRLDKNTTGALVVAKTNEAHQAFIKLFAQHRLTRRYWALCYGCPPGARETQKIETLIGRNPRDRKKMTTEVSEGSGKKALSWYRVLERYQQPRSPVPFASWVEVTLETGRTHQVRVHLTSIGASLLGDPLYGLPNMQQWKWRQLPSIVQDQVRCLPGQALHARILEFQHPLTQERLAFEAPVPSSFATLVSLLEQTGK